MALPLLKGVDEGVQLLSLQLHHLPPSACRRLPYSRGFCCVAAAIAARPRAAPIGAPKSDGKQMSSQSAKPKGMIQGLHTIRRAFVTSFGKQAFQLWAICDEMIMGD